MSAVEQEPYLYRTPIPGAPGKAYEPPAGFKPDEEIVTMLATKEKLGFWVSVKLNFKSAPAGATYEPRPNLAPFKSYEEMSKPYLGAENHSVGALNVDYVVRSAKARDVTPDSYVSSLRQTLADEGKDAVLFGAWGNDRLTNSIDEYAGWVEEAEAAYAAAATTYEQVAAA